MNNAGTYEPASEVIGPAFNELIARMRRARMLEGDPTRNPDGKLTDDERRIFEYGVEARKRVIEGSLTLIFGQWAVHRVVVRHRPRALRVLYTACCVGGTVMFVTRRARAVSQEMFARIVSLPTSSPMANEARVILAELEGPDGPYFRAVCREKAFGEDLHAVVATDPSADEEEAHIHPQLRLRPRLAPPINRRPRGLRDATDDSDDDYDGPVIVRRDATTKMPTRGVPAIKPIPTLERVREGEYDDSNNQPAWFDKLPDAYPNSDSQNRPNSRRHARNEIGDVYGEDGKEQSWRGRKQKFDDNGWNDKPVGQDELGDFADDMQQKPFDFANAAGAGDWTDEGTGWLEGDQRDESSYLTPSQKRAQERRERRRRAREKEFGRA